MAANEMQNLSRSFSAGHVLFHDGDPGHEMYVIQSGKVRICKTIRNVSQTLVILNAGEFFGEMSILSGQPRSATALLETDATLLVIDPKTFEAMVRGNAEIAVRMIKKLASRLQETDEHLENLLIRDPHSRVVHYLMTHAQRQGKSTPDGVVMALQPKEMVERLHIETAVIDAAVDKLVRAKLAKNTEQGLLLAEHAKLKQFLDFLEMKEKFGDV